MNVINKDLFFPSYHSYSVTGTRINAVLSDFTLDHEYVTLIKIIIRY